MVKEKAAGGKWKRIKFEAVNSLRQLPKLEHDSQNV